MPFKSKAQQRLFFAKEQRGELPKGTAKRWAKHTPDIKKLPERKGSEKKSFVHGFVTAFLHNIGLPREKAAKVLLPVLTKLALTPREIADAEEKAKHYKNLQVIKEYEAPPLPEEPKLKVERGKQTILTHAVTPFGIGTATGGLLAKAFRPSDDEVKNLQREELLAHYDTAIAELERRIATRS